MSQVTHSMLEKQVDALLEPISDVLESLEQNLQKTGTETHEVTTLRTAEKDLSNLLQTLSVVAVVFPNCRRVLLERIAKRVHPLLVLVAAMVRLKELRELNLKVSEPMNTPSSSPEQLSLPLDLDGSTSAKSTAGSSDGSPSF